MKITESQLRKMIRDVMNEEVADFSPRDKIWNDLIKWINTQEAQGAKEDEIKASIDKLLSTAFTGIKRRKSLKNS